MKYSEKKTLWGYLFGKVGLFLIRERKPVFPWIMSTLRFMAVQKNQLLEALKGMKANLVIRITIRVAHG